MTGGTSAGAAGSFYYRTPAAVRTTHVVQCIGFRRPVTRLGKTPTPQLPYSRVYKKACQHFGNNSKCQCRNKLLSFLFSATVHCLLHSLCFQLPQARIFMRKLTHSDSKKVWKKRERPGDDSRFWSKFPCDKVTWSCFDWSLSALWSRFIDLKSGHCMPCFANVHDRSLGLGVWGGLQFIGFA